MKKSLFSAIAVGLCLTANLMAQVPNYVPTNGLVGYWPFNGNANDESGNGNNGTVNGATLTTDRFGVANKAYSFDGSDRININSGNYDTLTISLWFKAPNQIHLYPTILSYNGSKLSAGIIKYPGWANQGHLRFYYTLAGQGEPNIISEDNTYHHLIISLDVLNSYYRIVIDNILISEGVPTESPSLWENLTNLTLGQEFSGPSINQTFFVGNIDDVCLYNRVLSQCEIQDLYNSQINSVTGSISVSPQPATIGSSVLLSTASQTQNVQWQTAPAALNWQNVPNNANYSGGTTNTLTVSNVQLSNHNQPFRVIASAGNCTDTSNIATIQIADTCITHVTVYDTLYTTVTDTLIINTTLSLPAPNNENTILIYPNPASDHITIDNGNFAAMAGYTIKIENNAGQQVFQSAINQAQFYVDLSTWTGNGLYFVHLIDPQNNTVTVRKIVLQ
jgi:hypothetical protein